MQDFLFGFYDSTVFPFNNLTDSKNLKNFHKCTYFSRRLSAISYCRSEGLQDSKKEALIPDTQNWNPTSNLYLNI